LLRNKHIHTAKSSNLKTTHKNTNESSKICEKNQSINNCLLIWGDFNGANSNTLCRLLKVKQINIKATRGRSIRANFKKRTRLLQMYKPSGTWFRQQNSYSHLIANIYKYQKSKQRKIVKRGGYIADTIEQIGNIEWDDLIKLYVPLQTKFGSIYDTKNAIQSQSLKIVRIKNDQPWMATHIKNLITERQKIFHINKNDDNKKWKKMANIIRHQIRKRKKSYYNRFKNRDG
jgi:hypothetical protein